MALEFGLGQTSGGLFLDPGLGKTSVTLKMFDVLRSEGMVERMLVIAPRRVARQVWPAELRDWTNFHHLTHSLLHGDSKEDALRTPADIYIINPDGLPWLLETNTKLFKSLNITMLAVDESSKFKHTNTQRFKMMRPWLPHFERRWMLTGTPNPNGYLDLFGQVYMIDLGATLGSYITHYKMKYFYPTGFGGYTWKLAPGAKEEIQKAIKPLVIRLDAEDYIKMPVVQNNVIRVELPPKARKAYDQMEDYLFTALDRSRVVEALSKGGALNKCSQIANGAVYFYDQAKENELGDLLRLGPKKTHTLHDAKLEALDELIEELNGAQLLIGYEFKHDAERIKKYFGKRITILEGGTSDKESQRIEDSWNAGAIQNLAAHPATMAHGLNMQKSFAFNICWFGVPWDYELYDQFIRRVRRSGNKAARMFVHHIIAVGTTDEAKMRALRTKEHDQQALLAALHTYRAVRKR